MIEETTVDCFWVTMSSREESAEVNASFGDEPFGIAPQ
ncbi:MAG: hypothetical protein ACI97A_003355 [Planctomycetota bacterium]|jgi:hypothetical protein